MTRPADAFLDGRIRLHQPARGAHRAGTDAVLLARLLVVEDGAEVCDAGAGSGAVGLSFAVLNAGCRVTLLEREPGLVELCRRNVAENDLSARVRVVAADLFAPAAERRAAGLVANFADVVLTNPPFLAEGEHRASPNEGRASAHVMRGSATGVGDLDRWLRACTDMLRPGGRLGLIHRADALPRCLAALSGRFGGVAVTPVHSRTDRPAIRILVTAYKGSRAPFGLHPPLVLDAPPAVPTCIEPATSGSALVR